VVEHLDSMGQALGLSPALKKKNNHKNSAGSSCMASIQIHQLLAGQEALALLCVVELWPRVQAPSQPPAQEQHTDLCV
jgi:hypothetical protein